MPIVMTNWNKAPFHFFDEDVELVAIGDIHGRADAFEAVLRALGDRPTLRKKRILVMLGDLIDRGPENLRCLDLVMKAKELACADDFYLLPGNHELMLVDALNGDKYMFNIWFNNGGHAVLDEVCKMLKVDVPNTIPECLEYLKEGLPVNWLNAVVNAPNNFRLGNVVCVHAGVAPNKPVEETLNLPREEHIGRYNMVHWAWIRDYFLLHDKGFGKHVIIHGHTCEFNRLRLRELVDQDDIRVFMDKAKTRGRINLDAGAARTDRVGFAMIEGRRYRIGVAHG